MALTKTQAWLRGIAAGFIGSGANAVLASLGIAGAEAIGIPVQPLNWQQLGLVFVSGAVVGTLLVLKQSPLPPAEE